MVYYVCIKTCSPLLDSGTTAANDMLHSTNDVCEELGLWCLMPLSTIFQLCLSILLQRFLIMFCHHDQAKISFQISIFGAIVFANQIDR